MTAIAVSVIGLLLSTLALMFALKRPEPAPPAPRSHESLLFLIEGEEDAMKPFLTETLRDAGLFGGSMLTRRAPHVLCVPDELGRETTERMASALAAERGLTVRWLGRADAYRPA